MHGFLHGRFPSIYSLVGIGGLLLLLLVTFIFIGLTMYNVISNVMSELMTGNVIVLHFYFLLLSVGLAFRAMKKFI